MNPLMGMSGEGEGTNLLSILINIAFGFVAGLMVFLGFQEVIDYGSKIAGEIIKATGYGQQMAMFGLATTAAPYVVLAPIGGMVVKQLSSVRSIKSFAFFAAAVALGFAAAFFAQGYVLGLMS
jgi:hypothetical protein